MHPRNRLGILDAFLLLTYGCLTEKLTPLCGCEQVRKLMILSAKVFSKCDGGGLMKARLAQLPLILKKLLRCSAEGDQAITECHHALAIVGYKRHIMRNNDDGFALLL